MFAYASVLSTDSYAPGVRVLWESLKRTEPAYDFYLLVTGEVSSDCENRLRSIGMNVIRDDTVVLDQGDLPDRDHRWRFTFEKMKVFNRLEFEKIVYLDADMYICRNIDALFGHHHLSAVENRAPQLWLDGRRYFNSGLMVVEPSVEEFEEVRKLIIPAIERCTEFGISCGDQNVLAMHAAYWPDRKELHLDDGYNVFWGSIDTYLADLGFTLRGGGGVAPYQRYSFHRQTEAVASPIPVSL